MASERQQSGDRGQQGEEPYALRPAPEQQGSAGQGQTDHTTCRVRDPHLLIEAGQKGAAVYQIGMRQPGT
jgi:hypothetical protein